MCVFSELFVIVRIKREKCQIRGKNDCFFVPLACKNQHPPIIRAVSNDTATKENKMEHRPVQSFVPWIALAISILALVLSLVALLRGGAETTPGVSVQAPVFDTTPGAAVPSGTPPDLSTMTPREAADRLFNRVMTAVEANDMAEAQRFVPMALSAYNNLGALDNDARYHVALLHLAVGDLKGAREQADQLLRSDPSHLLGLMLEYMLAARAGNANAAMAANKKFLAAYKTEMAKGRQEYTEHQTGIDRFRTDAQSAVKQNK